jgi:hypothetical protein
MALVRNTIKFSSGGGGSDITVVANYSALPDPTTVSGQFYWCSASQGVEWTPDWAWLPLGLGDPYFPKGMYYSNGTIWEYAPTPFQATQSEVNTGTNNDKFVTPETLKNQNYLATIAYADAKISENIKTLTLASPITTTSTTAVDTNLSTPIAIGETLKFNIDLVVSTSSYICLDVCIIHYCD